MSEWIKASDRLPTEDGMYLVWKDNRNFVNLYRFVSGEWIPDYGHPKHITHWMPLPEPPEVKS